MNKIYCIKGFNELGYRRYIQLGDMSRIPAITTRAGYRSYNQIVFTSFMEAANFLLNFVISDKRKVKWPIKWKISEYKPVYGMEFIQERSTWFNDFKNRSTERVKFTRVPYMIETMYGPAYKLKTISEVENA